MAILKNYAIWNNKGGVGKSTITYHIATRYAETHPENTVLVIDLCPQANVSMMLLNGGNGSLNVIAHSQKTPAKTIVGYLTEVMANGQGAKRPEARDFVTKVHDENPKLPSNLFLLCGDGMLEMISPYLIAQSNMHKITQNQEEPLAWIHNTIRRMIDDFDKELDIKNLVVFIDTNPAFGIYTEIALSSADKLICPLNADDSSRIAASAMMILLHGSNPPHPIYSQWAYATKAKQNGIQVPQVHLIIGNRMTQYSGNAAAYQAMSEATAEILYHAYKDNPEYFSTSANEISNIQEFQNEYAVSLRDFNTAGVVTTYEGTLLSQLQDGKHNVHNKEVAINSGRRNDCLDSLNAVLAKI